MRFKLTLNIEHQVYGNKLPINYQYELSAWIYRIISQGDRQYAEWLHQNGFSDEKFRKFKLFVFSNLYSPGIKYDKDRLILNSDKASFYLSLLPEKSTEAFIKGIFCEQAFSLGDSISRVQLNVQQIELIPPPDFSDNFVFKTSSPVVVATQEDRDHHPQYLSPDENDYGQMVINNLKEKYKSFYHKPFEGDENFAFELLSPARSKLIKIKAGTKEETRVRGFVFTFRLQADHDLLKVMHEAGLGEKNAQGFGCVESKSQESLQLS